MSEFEANPRSLSPEQRATLSDVNRLLFTSGVGQKYHRLLEFTGRNMPTSLASDAAHQELPVALIIGRNDEGEIQSIVMTKVSPNTGQVIRESREPVVNVDKEGAPHIITPTPDDTFAFSSHDAETLLEAARLQMAGGLEI